MNVVSSWQPRKVKKAPHKRCLEGKWHYIHKHKQRHPHRNKTEHKREHCCGFSRKACSSYWGTQGDGASHGCGAAHPSVESVVPERPDEV